MADTKITILPVGFLRTNCYIADDGSNCAVIDPGGDADKILRFIEDENLSCRAILITHGHSDHTGALKKLKEKTGATVYMNKADAKMSPVTPDVLCDESSTITVGQMTFSVVETPGHTQGCVCYLLGDTMFSGDTLFFESVGRTDLPGGDYPTLRASLIKLRDLPYSDMRVLPGHMEETTLAHERQYNPFIERA